MIFERKNGKRYMEIKNCVRHAFNLEKKEVNVMRVQTTSFKKSVQCTKTFDYFFKEGKKHMSKTNT